MSKEIFDADEIVEMEIDALERSLMKAREDDGWFITADKAKDFSRALTAFRARRDEVMRRSTQLESRSNADRSPDLRDQLDPVLLWMEQTTAMMCKSDSHHIAEKETLLRLCQSALAPMRKGKA